MRRAVLAAAMLSALLPAPGAPSAAAQSFAGLGGAAADGFERPRPGIALRFPEDHGAHPAFRIEWWYLTANLKGADGREYGAQWTLFRQAGRPNQPAEAGWPSETFWMAHAALTSAERHVFAERLARGGVGQAGVEASPFSAWLDDWRLSAPDAASSETLGRLSVRAGGVSEAGAPFGYALTLTADGPLALQGRGGYSVKSPARPGAPAQASYYYSQPRYSVAGRIRLGGREVAVTGRAWLDREWSSQPLAPDQTGWDWFSLHFDSGEKAMLFRLRRRDGGADLAGNWIDREGVSYPLSPSEITIAPLDAVINQGTLAPKWWRISIPSRGLSVTTRPLNPEAWMRTRFAYWEGPIRLDGSHAGEGYLEMTGYPIESRGR